MTHLRRPLRRTMLGPALLTASIAVAGWGAEPARDALDLPGSEAGPGPDGDGWIELFNGRDLTGWTPKIRGEAPGDDPRGTFRVADGLLVVSYEGYDAEAGFLDAFGHLFYDEPFRAYELLVEYRFVAEQLAGGPEWARANSGVMFHAQAPETMGIDQDFPVSLEAQFLGGAPDEVRPTGNLCTPGTHVHIDGVRIERHCVEAAAPTIPVSTWTTMRLIVPAEGSIHHVVDGDTVLSYGDPVVGGGEANGTTSDAPPAGTPLSAGHIALQSESHPIEFRRVAVRPLTPRTPGGG